MDIEMLFPMAFHKKDIYLALNYLSSHFVSLQQIHIQVLVLFEEKDFLKTQVLLIIKRIAK